MYRSAFMKNIIWRTLFLGILLSSCSGVKTAQFNSQLIDSNCNQQNAYSYSKDELPQPLYEIELDSALVKQFSFKSLNIANAIGVLEYLEKYVKIHADISQNPSIEQRIEIIELSNKINQRINLSSLEISAVVSEIDCEEERADQLAAYMKGKEKDAETKLTVGAIVVGAVGAISSGILLSNGDKTNTPEFIGIGTGLIEATLGILILTNNKKAEFHHTRNVLKDIWEGRETSIAFPPSVWYYLNFFDPKHPDNHSLRYQIIDRWMGFEQISTAKSKKKRNLFNIYFGEGGKYTSQELKTRSNMLDQLEAQVSLMKQDLKGLASELEQISKDN